MEAVRVRAAAHEDLFSDAVKLSDYPRAHAVAALETGTLSVAAATLIQAGFASRLAAIRAVADTGATFDSMASLVGWLASDEVQKLSANPLWPTPESHVLWVDFNGPAASQKAKPWATRIYTSQVFWFGEPPPQGVPLRIGGGPGKERRVYSADFSEIGLLGGEPNQNASGLVVATTTVDTSLIAVEYTGPDDLLSP